ncbi:MAG: SufE family protein [Ignavibacteria bacterium]|jgi:cysteine desulfuration protein SufE
MTIQETQEQLIKEFEEYQDWEDRYKHIIKLGRELPPVSEEVRNEKYKLEGCQSQVWINAKLEDGKVIIEADSDAMIVKGLIALLIKVYSNHTPDEILKTPPEFLNKLGIASHLSPTRKNGLGSMLKEIQRIAIAYKTIA